MKITSEQVKQTAKNIGTGLYNSSRATGKFAIDNAKIIKENADKFISSSAKLTNAKEAVKANKEVIVGGAIILGATALAISCIKGIVNKVKDVVKTHKE